MMSLKSTLSVRSRRALAAAALSPVIAVLLLPGAAVGDDKLPSGAEVMDRYVESTGGQAYTRIRNRVRKGVIEDITNEYASFKVYEAEPNKSYHIIEAEIYNFERGTYGDVSWARMPSGAHLKSGPLKDQEMLDAFFHMPLKWREVIKEVKCTEIVEFEGERCYKLVVTPKVGEDEIWHIETKTGFLRGVTREVHGRKLSRITTDYKEVDGILYPHRIDRKADETSYGPMFIHSIEHNVALPADRFEPPPEVRELIEEEKAKAKEAEQGDSSKPTVGKTDQGTGAAKSTKEPGGNEESRGKKPD